MRRFIAPTVGNKIFRLILRSDLSTTGLFFESRSREIIVQLHKQISFMML